MLRVFSRIDMKSLVNVWSWNYIQLVIKMYLDANDPADLSSNPRISFHICQKIILYAFQWTKWLKKGSISKIIYLCSGIYYNFFLFYSYNNTYPSLARISPVHARQAIASTLATFRGILTKSFYVRVTLFASNLL